MPGHVLEALLIMAKGLWTGLRPKGWGVGLLRRGHHGIAASLGFLLPCCRATRGY